MNSNKCPSCGSTNIYQESANIFRCGDCFDKLPSASLYDSPPPKVYGTNQKLESFSFTKYKYIIIAVVVGWMFLGTVITSISQWINLNNTATTKEESQEIAIDPSVNNVEIQPEGEFTLLGEIRDTIGNIYFVGKFENQSESTLLMPKITVNLLAEDGTNVGKCEGYGDKNFLTKSESVSYEVLCTDAPKYHHYELLLTGTNYVAEFSRPNFTLSAINVKKVKNKGTVITGKIQNSGSTIANYTRIKCLLVGANGKTFDYGTYTWDQEDFPIQETRTFSLEFFRSKESATSYYCDADAVNQEAN